MSRFRKMLRRWFPRQPPADEVLPRLAEFYKKNHAYYEMTDTGGKAGEPQARLLSCLI